MRISLCREGGESVKRVEPKDLRDGSNNWAICFAPISVVSLAVGAFRSLSTL
jgi:hypothetical protein